jgi:hypothetical protein
MQDFFNFFFMYSPVPVRFFGNAIERPRFRFGSHGGGGTPSPFTGKFRKNPEIREEDWKKLEKFSVLFSTFLRYISPGMETRV